MLKSALLNLAPPQVMKTLIGVNKASLCTQTHKDKNINNPVSPSQEYCKGWQIVIHMLAGIYCLTKKLKQPSPKFYKCHEYLNCSVSHQVATFLWQYTILSQYIHPCSWPVIPLLFPMPQ